MTARTVKVLPREYRETAQLDLQNNKKEMLLVNGAALLIAVVMAVIGAFITPYRAFFDTQSPLPSILRIAVMLAGTFAYLILHEAIHGIFMLVFGKGVKPTFGFTGIYAYTASRAYFCRREYLVIGLSPVLLLGGVLLVLNIVVPTAWFWVVYIIQIFNVSGAAGDLYVTVRLLCMPSTLLVQDSGTAMRVYLPKKKRRKK